MTTTPQAARVGAPRRTPNEKTEGVVSAYGSGGSRSSLQCLDLFKRRALDSSMPRCQKRVPLRALAAKRLAD